MKKAVLLLFALALLSLPVQLGEPGGMSEEAKKGDTGGIM